MCLDVEHVTLDRGGLAADYVIVSMQKGRRKTSRLGISKISVYTLFGPQRRAALVYICLVKKQLWHAVR